MHLKTKKRIVIITAVIAIAAVLILQHKNILGYLYPLKYDEIILKYSKEFGLDPYLVRALINVESHYNASAESSKDAKGLMQITPQTGKWAAQTLGINNFKEDMLFNPEINIRIGCWYLYSLKQEFKIDNEEPDLILLLAAYNGGSGNVRKWLKNKQYSQTGTSLDQIPFKETEQYVKKVMMHYKIYKWIYCKGS